MKRKNKAQSILEYAILLAILAVALQGMTLYFRRGIQSVIKVAADEFGEQRKGAVDYDYKYEWKWKDISNVTSLTSGDNTTTVVLGGAVSYAENETTQQSGLLSAGRWTEKD